MRRSSRSSAGRILSVLVSFSGEARGGLQVGHRPDRRTRRSSTSASSAPTRSVRILGKLEGQNPAGSVKDRIARAMIAEAEADGTLTPGKTIIEPSSGNTGIALAMICRLQGLPAQDRAARERVDRAAPAARGVRRRDHPVAPATRARTARSRRAQALAEEHPEWAFLYQYANEANPRAHYETTGPEILRDVPDITHFVAGLGTSGTLMGVGTYLKEHKPDVKVLRRRAAVGRAGRGPAQPRRRLHPAGLREVGRPRAARRQADRPAPRVARVDPPAGGRGRRVRRHLLRRGARRRGQAGRADRGGHHRVHRLRRRLEVPLDRRLHRRPRRRRANVEKVIYF